LKAPKDGRGTKYPRQRRLSRRPFIAASRPGPFQHCVYIGIIYPGARRGNKKRRTEWQTLLGSVRRLGNTCRRGARELPQQSFPMRHVLSLADRPRAGGGAGPNPPKKKIFWEYDTTGSRVITDLSTNGACRCLTSQIGRDVVLSPEYGRTQRSGRSDAHVVEMTLGGGN
jgi:hypothetical protein